MLMDLIGWAVIRMSYIALACFFVLALMLPVFSLVITADAVQTSYISLLTEDSTFMVINTKSDGKKTLGSGFHVYDKAGKIHFITNHHVCNTGHPVNVTLYNSLTEKTYPSKYIRVSAKTDLCELSPIKGAPALGLSLTSYRGQQIFIVGHPTGLNLHVSGGVIVDGRDNVDTWPSGLVGPKACAKFGGKNVKLLDRNTFRLKWHCVQRYLTFQTSAIVMGGNSGGPVVNVFGQVVGILHKKNRAYWGSMIPFTNIYEFLNNEEK